MWSIVTASTALYPYSCVASKRINKTNKNLACGCELVSESNIEQRVSMLTICTKAQCRTE